MTAVPGADKETDTFRDYLIDEFVEDYQEQRLTRRDALKKLTYLTGSVAAASTLLAARRARRARSSAVTRRARSGAVTQRSSRARSPVLRPGGSGRQPKRPRH